MQQNHNFTTSYQQELTSQGRKAAPQVAHEEDKKLYYLPVNVKVASQQKLLDLNDTEQIITSCSPHEITLIMAPHPDEMDLAEFLLKRYEEHPQRQKNLTNVSDIAVLVNQVFGLCAVNGPLLAKTGARIIECFGSMAERLNEKIITELRNEAKKSGPFW